MSSPHPQFLGLRFQTINSDLPKPVYPFHFIWVIFIITVSYQDSDKSALLEFKSSVKDPARVLSGWDVSKNLISGNLISGMGFKSYLSFNLLSGDIPDEIGYNCGSLEHLELSGNLLVGGIPSSLGNCTKLQSLLLYSNLLQEEIPFELGYSCLMAPESRVAQR
ncbi:receptor-like protein kinase 2 [Artemisia annua]|uniref:Receptor-like protein kinase 2 n=1 Tax=Artemisia annua TaxID=35608 RepID=A0A2U1N4C4_ARTAN|nr:receptor-like protein kinase 2 [Artemisia annua]